jgi:hypothetical protein
MLDEIVLKHEDLISTFFPIKAIVHRMFPNNIKKEIIAGIKKIFISFKIADAKYIESYAEFTLQSLSSIYCPFTIQSKRENSL